MSELQSNLGYQEYYSFIQPTPNTIFFPPEGTLETSADYHSFMTDGVGNSISLNNFTHCIKGVPVSKELYDEYINKVCVKQVTFTDYLEATIVKHKVKQEKRNGRQVDTGSHQAPGGIAQGIRSSSGQDNTSQQASSSSSRRGQVGQAGPVSRDAQETTLSQYTQLNNMQSNLLESLFSGSSLLNACQSAREPYTPIEELPDIDYRPQIERLL